MAEFESCSKCKFDGKSPTEKPCCICTHGTSDYYKPKSNADRIRAMSDAELAELFFGRFAKWNEECDKDKLADFMFTRKERFLQWLKQEVKE